MELWHSPGLAAMKPRDDSHLHEVGKPLPTQQRTQIGTQRGLVSARLEFSEFLTKRCLLLPQVCNRGPPLHQQLANRVELTEHLCFVELTQTVSSLPLQLPATPLSAPESRLYLRDTGYSVSQDFWGREVVPALGTDYPPWPGHVDVDPSRVTLE